MINRNIPYSYLAFALFILICCTLGNASASLTLTADTQTSTAGYYRLAWSIDGADIDQIFVLQEAVSADFENPTITYQGPDLATVVSGKSNGQYYYRVRRMQPDPSAGVESSEDSWSNVVSVSVEHHSLPRAVGFFVAGLIVFVATLVVIVSSARKSNV